MTPAQKLIYDKNEELLKYCNFKQYEAFRKKQRCNPLFFRKYYRYMMEFWYYNALQFRLIEERLGYVKLFGIKNEE
jgi:hypothetical protein